ncbi:MAG TPA: TIGR00297 family protein [Cyanobacteria bacterium UBA11149]|nr:TIGR00297 family protein [Cyanobacteria bacterium UBA11367]HBE58136.1 TIGR00297 family protein [Cyanobacteria bacterium UBA11366]HBK62912.1 TIGR00297 family protein [Cyanobacteria bacterium UBA11166]HBR75702.1 TIGR00297 family protein [Cyanobacteria bacterium UBA11159]HBS69777.1 TIGR00297 family protein [Cyanobacteria bacterium UBA11153]HBW88457.1 TIGR00297 family protein [Cyanobacteria bacterium UBA11149]HCA95523.1 TIGR00297 family protein [Cyanobacteria bacterium UBA9226]
MISSLNPWLIATGLNATLLGIALFLPKSLLTLSGLLHACGLGILIWGTLGWQGYLVVMFYFLVGSAVTRIGMKEKEAAGIAEKRSGARGPENVWGSALTGAICALATLFVDEPLRSLLLLGYVASFATKLSDTTASEVGKAYGNRTFLITTLQPVARGTEGAVSLEGTLAGIIASIAIAFLGWGIGLIDLTGVLFCVLAAFIATNLESVIGATLQSEVEWMTNEVVNFINTTIGAIAVVILALGWQLIN